MMFQRANLRKSRQMGIFTKLVLVSVISTVLPLLMIASALLISAYQDILEESFKNQQIPRGISQGLALAWQDTRVQLSLALLLIVILAFLGSILMSRHLVRPLKKILKGTNEITKGNLDFKIKVASRDEMGELANHFNEMTHQLKEARTAIEESRAVLEIKVKARTKELEELAHSLEDKVKERTRELQQRVEELEKFHKLAVGRELKMIDLKKVLREAEEKLEKMSKLKRQGPEQT